MATPPKRPNRLTIPSSPPLEEGLQEYFSCSYPDCDYKSNWEDNVGRHEESHNPNGNRNIPCQVCPQSFGYLVSFFYHMTRKHSNKLFCPWCLFLGEDWTEFKTHMLDHILTPAAPSSSKTGERGFQYCCVNCSRTFTSKKEFYRHHKRNHCTPNLFTKSAVKGKTRHDSQNSGEVQRTLLACDKCSFKTLYAQSLHWHRRTHSSEKPFKCQNLGCAFKTHWPKGLRQHQRSCQIQIQKQAAVGNKKNTDGTIETLMEKVKAVKKETRLFSCTICNFRSKWRSSLRYHLMVHKEDKPFRCPRKDCTYQTKWLGDLRKHSRRVHSNNKPPKVPLQTKGNLGSNRESEYETGGIANDSSSLAFACLLCDFIGDSELSALKHACQHKTVVISLNRIS